MTSNLTSLLTASSRYSVETDTSLSDIPIIPDKNNQQYITTGYGNNQQTGDDYTVTPVRQSHQGQMADPLQSIVQQLCLHQFKYLLSQRNHS